MNEKERYTKYSLIIIILVITSYSIHYTKLAENRNKIEAF